MDSLNSSLALGWRRLLDSCHMGFSDIPVCFFEANEHGSKVQHTIFCNHSDIISFVTFCWFLSMRVGSAYTEREGITQAINTGSQELLQAICLQNRVLLCPVRTQVVLVIQFAQGTRDAFSSVQFISKLSLKYYLMIKQFIL